MTDNFEYSDLRKIEKEERNKEAFVNLPENFLEKASNLIRRKRESGRQQEYRNTRRLFRKLMEVRRRKVLTNARVSTKSELKISDLNLLPDEKELLLGVKTEIEENKEKIERLVEKKHGNDLVEDRDSRIQQNKNEPEEEQKNSEDAQEGYKKVHLKKQVPEFMGTDLESYGPFDKGEKAEIPEENAEILVNKGSAEVK